MSDNRTPVTGDTLTNREDLERLARGDAVVDATGDVWVVRGRVSRGNDLSNPLNVRPHRMARFFLLDRFPVRVIYTTAEAAR